MNYIFQNTVLVRRGYFANISHCPETSKDANGLNKYCRIKALLNVAEDHPLRRIELKLN
jgi:hypothetical protein